MEFALLYPMFAMVLLTFSVLVRLFLSRSRSVAAGKVAAAHFRTYNTDAVEPEASLQLSRHFSNLFETPTLFYVACIAAMITAVSNVIFIALAWAYVLCRVAHAYIHTGSNRLQARINAYFASWIVLLTFWIYLVIRVGALA